MPSFSRLWNLIDGSMCSSLYYWYPNEIIASQLRMIIKWWFYEFDPFFYYLLRSS